MNKENDTINTTKRYRTCDRLAITKVASETSSGNWKQRHRAIVAAVLATLAFTMVSTVSTNAEASEIVIEVVTRIDPGDPVSGMKSTHRIGVDFRKKNLRRLKVETGTTYGLPSTRDMFSEQVIRWDGCSRGGAPLKCVELRLTGRTASGVQIMPNIDYDFTIILSYDGLVAIHGCHDGYPTYVVKVRGQTLYHFTHKSIRVLKLFGNCDTKVRTSIGGWVGY